MAGMMPKQGIALLLDKGGSEPDSDDMDTEAKTTAAKDFIAAVKAGDPAALASAFERLQEACSGYDEEEE